MFFRRKDVLRCGKDRTYYLPVRPEADPKVGCRDCFGIVSTVPNIDGGSSRGFDNVLLLEKRLDTGRLTANV